MVALLLRYQKTSFTSVNLRSIAQSLSIALATSALVTLVPAAPLAAVAADPSQILFNSGTCELTAAGYAGSGAENDPYQISDSDSLWESADCSVSNSSAANFLLLADIDVRDATLAPTSSPIGLSASGSIIPFRGSFDGSYYTIKNISISSSTTGVGLFGQLEDAQVRKLRLDGLLQTSAQMCSTHSAGALAAWSGGQVLLSEVENYATVTGVECVGGLVGWTDGPTQVSDSLNLGSIAGDMQVGGLIGWSAAHVTISNSVNHADVTAALYEVGGLIGFVDSTVFIEGASNFGDVTAVSNYGAGGFVGFAQGPLQIVSGGNHAIISANESAGGLVGYVWGSLTIENSQNSSTVSVATTYSGGLVGYGQGSVAISGSSNSGEVTANRDAGGLIGYCDATADILNSQNRGPITTMRGDAAGLIGACDGEVRIGNSTNTGPISSAFGAGGLVSHAGDGAIVTDSLNEGDVIGSDFVGGLVGDGWNFVDIFRSTNSGQIMGNESVGGLVGWSSAFSLSEVVNFGDVFGSNAVGGIVGFTAESSTLSSFVNFGEVIGNDNVSGGIGQAVNWGTGQVLVVSNSRNMGAVFGNNYVGGLIGITNEAFSINIRTSANTVTISASGILVGGLVGGGLDVTEIEESFNSGDVTGADDVGGLIGWSSASASIVKSFNSGNISASMSDVAGRLESAGGLIGNARSTVAIESSYNAGNVSSRLASGGLVGFSYVAVLITKSYSVGSVNVEAVGSADGLIGIASDSSLVVVDATYVSKPSIFVSHSAESLMKTADLFSGWNFSSLWGFGECTQFGGFPTLRFAAQVSTYYTSGCYSNPASAQPSSEPNSFAAPKLPTFDKGFVRGFAGQNVEVSGTNLDLILTATAASKPVGISIKSSTTILLAIPVLEPGIISLELETLNGKVVYQGFLEIVAQTPTVVADSEFIISGVNPRSSWLTDEQQKSISALPKEIQTVTCIAYNHVTGLIARKKAVSRAKQACMVASELGYQTKVFVYGKAPRLADTVKILSR